MLISIDKRFDLNKTNILDFENVCEQNCTMMSCFYHPAHPNDPHTRCSLVFLKKMVSYSYTVVLKRSDLFKLSYNPRRSVRYSSAFVSCIYYFKAYDALDSKPVR